MELHGTIRVGSFLCLQLLDCCIVFPGQFDFVFGVFFQSTKHNSSKGNSITFRFLGPEGCTQIKALNLKVYCLGRNLANLFQA